ncbi:MAG: BlaI/MecI/CopY family transcriptional regulator [Actinomycetota bacterium]
MGRSEHRGRDGLASHDAQGRLGDLQSAVLDDLWREGESSIGAVRDRLRARGTPLAYTTVLTVMARLAQRGLLVRRREGRRDLYRPAVTPGELDAALSREAVDRVLTLHGEAAIGAFLARMRDGDPAQLARLRALLDEADR